MRYHTVCWILVCLAAVCSAGCSGAGNAEGDADADADPQVPDAVDLEVRDSGEGETDDAADRVEEDPGDADTADMDAEDGALELTLNTFPASMKCYPQGNALLLAEVVTNPPTASVSFSATADPDVPFEVMPADSTEPGVREILVRPQAEQLGSTIAILLTAASGGLVREATLNVEVLDWPAENDPTALDIRDLFVDWIATNRPELGIDASTVWEDLGSYAQVIIVTHELFLSADWEMQVSWHNMIPPDDWAEAYLRRRSEMAPSWAARIESYSTDQTVTETTPPETVFRGF